MFGKKKASDNPEVQKAEADRDILLGKVDDVVAAAKKVTTELMRQYDEADRWR